MLLVSQTELERGVGEVLIDEDRLQERIRDLGRELSSDSFQRRLCSHFVDRPFHVRFTYKIGQLQERRIQDHFQWLRLLQ